MGASGKFTATSWLRSVIMDEALGQRHSTTHPVLITSFPEDMPGPSAVVDDQEEEEEEENDKESQPEPETKKQINKN